MGQQGAERRIEKISGEILETISDLSPKYCFLILNDDVDNRLQDLKKSLLGKIEARKLAKKNRFPYDSVKVHSVDAETTFSDLEEEIRNSNGNPADSSRTLVLIADPKNLVRGSMSYGLKQRYFTVNIKYYLNGLG